MTFKKFLFLVLFQAISLQALAVIEIAPLANEELEQRYRDLIEELRCPKCQNQNLADSNSPIAADLREQVRTLLEEGRSDDEIVDYLVERYGDFVRYRPALKSNTAVLWLAPGVLAVIGIIAFILVIRTNRKSPIASGDLTTEEQLRLDELLKSEESGEDSSGQQEGKV